MRVCLIIFYLLSSISLNGCTATGWSGVSGISLIHSPSPFLNVMAKEPLVLQGYGRQWVSLPTDYLGNQPTGFMNYVVYGEGISGPVSRHAHAMIVQPSNLDFWEFKPESYPAPGGFHIGKTALAGRQWVTQILRVDGEKDWFSAMWRQSGREVPDFWIARRFSSTPMRTTRFVAEYREPWPQCLDPEVKELTLVPASCIEGFLSRADRAFDFEEEIPETPEGATVPDLLTKPQFPPDMKRLAGELMENLRIQFWR